MLDAIDRKIVQQLDINARLPISTIARRIGCSKSTVLYRMNRFKERGIIRSYQATVDFGKLGYLGFRVFLKLRAMTEQVQQELVQYVRSQDAIMWAVGVEGPYDFGMFFHTKTIKEMNTLWQGFEERFREHIEEVQFAVQTHITSYARQYLVSDARNTFSCTMYSEPSPEPLDNIDMGILRCLSNDARMPVLELASELKTTAKTIIAHLKQLESSEVITAYRPIIEVNAIGYDYFKVELKLFNTTQVRLKALDQYIEEHPQIVYRDWALGGADIEIEVHVKGMPGLRELLNDMMNKFAPIIQDTRTMHFYQEYKYYFVPFETKEGKV